MRHLFQFLALLAGLCILATAGIAQPPRDKGGKQGDKGDRFSPEALVNRMMAFDKNKDGKLTKDEITEERLLRVFERADANKDGVVTKEELSALAAQEAALQGGGGERGKGGDRGREGFGRGKGDRDKGGFGGFEKGGRGGFGGFGGPPQPGQVLPVFMQEELKLTAEQKKMYDELQKEVDARLDKILTADQKAMLREIRERRGGRPPFEGGRGGEGGRFEKK